MHCFPHRCYTRRLLNRVLHISIGHLPCMETPDRSACACGRSTAHSFSGKWSGSGAGAEWIGKSLQLLSRRSRGDAYSRGKVGIAREDEAIHRVHLTDRQLLMASRRLTNRRVQRIFSHSQALLSCLLY